MKKLLCAVLCLLLTGLIVLPSSAAEAEKEPNVWINTAWEEIPEGAVFLDLLVPGNAFPARSAKSARETYGIPEDAEILRYEEDGLKSLSFCLKAGDCYPELMYHADFTATKEAYAQNEGLFRQLGDYLETVPGEDEPYVCNTLIPYGTPEAGAARSLTRILKPNARNTSVCLCFFYVDADVRTLGTVRAVFADGNGKVLGVSDPWQTNGADETLRLYCSNGVLRDYDEIWQDRYLSRSYSLGKGLAIFIAVVIAGAIAAAVILKRRARAYRMH